MTTTHDLSPEQLDELEETIEQAGSHPTRAESRVLIAMARAKQAAERERDALRGQIAAIRVEVAMPARTGWQCFICGQPMSSHSDSCVWAQARAALAQPTTEGGE